MKEIKDRELLHHYLTSYKLDHVFHETLLEHLSLFGFEQGEEICSQGEAAQFLHILVKGKVKIYTTSAEGKTLIVSFRTPLELIGDIEYIRNMDIINTVEAISPVHMIKVDYRWLNKHVKDYPPFLHFLLEVITKKFAMKSNSLTLNVMAPVDVRLASYLLSMSMDEPGTDPNHVKINIKDTANFIGTSYRHLNRVIHHYCAEGIILREKGFIVIKDREALRRIAGL